MLYIQQTAFNRYIFIYDSRISRIPQIILKTVKAIIPTVSAVSIKLKSLSAFDIFIIVATSLAIFIPP